MITETSTQDTVTDLAVTLIFLTFILSVIALVVAIVGQKDMAITVEMSPLDVVDMKIAVTHCIPRDATPEQTVACYQAVYGGKF